MIGKRNSLKRKLFNAGYATALLGCLMSGSVLAQTSVTIPTDYTVERFYANKANTEGIEVHNLNNGALSINFRLQHSGPVELKLRGYDIDTANEVRIQGDNFSAFLKRGINNGLSEVERIDLGYLSAGNHQYTFSNNRRSTWRWGISELEVLTEFNIDGGVYAVGDVGPAGGIVFHVDSSGTSGLEAARNNVANSVWCNQDIDIDWIWNTDYDVDPRSSGEMATGLIIEFCGERTAAGRAAKYVWPNGQTDGYLPNAQEASLLHSNRRKIGGFRVDAYWTSSEAEFLALAMFGTNNDLSLDYLSKSSKAAVRPIRAFYGR